MKPSDTDRRKVAAMLRGLGIAEFDDEEFIDCGEVEDTLGLVTEDGAWYRAEGVLHLADLIQPQEITGSTSDGYHTFNELYDHRAKLFSVVVSAFRDIAWKSKLHSDGTMYEGMFIVGINTPQGQAAYHYNIEPYWDMFNCYELEKAPKWDGHTPSQAIDRIADMAKLATSKRTCRRIMRGLKNVQGFVGGFCSECEHPINSSAVYCEHCGAKVIKE
jgi:hypothetical protein